MSKMFEKIKMFYETGVWPLEWVHDAVIKGKITEAEYAEIVGEPFEN